jgi:hypothetical protein
MAATTPINYSALSGYHKVLTLWRCTVLAGLCIFACALALSFFALPNPGVHETPRYRRAEQALGVTELAGVLVAVSAYLRYLTVRDRCRERVFAHFVSDNGWTVSRKYDKDKVAGTLLSVGDAHEQHYSVDGTFKGYQFSCLLTDYMASDSSVRRYICLGFTLPKAYPMIILNNQLNDHRLRRDDDLPQTLPGGVELELEGDFSDKFQASTTKGSEREMLSVLTPDFMAALEDTAAKKVDIEIGGKKLFLIYEADYYSVESVSSLFTVADVMLEKFTKLSKTWLASSKGAEADISKGASVARSGLVFKMDWLSVVLAAVTFVVFMALIISHIMDTNADPPCTASNPCSAPSFHAY